MSKPGDIRKKLVDQVQLDLKFSALLGDTEIRSRCSGMPAAQSIDKIDHTEEEHLLE
jgi:hypothetical protein